MQTRLHRGRRQDSAARAPSSASFNTHALLPVGAAFLVFEFFPSAIYPVEPTFWSNWFLGKFHAQAICGVRTVEELWEQDGIIVANTA